MTRTDRPNPLPQLILDRARRARELLWEKRFERTESLSPELAGPFATKPDLSEASGYTFEPVKPGTFFSSGKDWDHVVFRIEIPEAKSGELGRRQLRWLSQGESTIYLDGEPWAGLDIGHAEAPLPDRACTLLLDCGCWQTGIWAWTPETGHVLEHGLRFDKAELIVRDEAAWSAHWDFDVWIRLTEHLLEQEGYVSGIPQMCFRPPLDETSPLVRLILAGLDRAVAAFRKDGAAAASASLAELSASLPSEAWQPVCSLLGHAHLDLVWLWPESASVHKAVHTTATLERLFEKYPEFVFSQSMAAWYRMVEAAEPNQARRIQEHIDAGRWEATGAMEVESDTLVPCGEALVRAVVYGNEKLTELRGSPSPLCWLPDTFGYSSALPQILSLAGVPWFFTTKLSWSMVNRFPWNKFRWQSPDGSEVVSYLFTTDYNQAADPKAIREQTAKNRQLEIHNEILMPTGYGDGAGGPAEYMLERAQRMADISGVPKCRWSTAEAFMSRLAEHADELPVHRGELYLEAHRGTTTTQSEIKRLYREGEKSLQAREAARVVTRQGPLEAEAWHRLLFSQFHDALPGSSITRVFDELRPELASIGQTQSESAQQELGSGDAWFNPVPLERMQVLGAKGSREIVRAGPLASVTAERSSEDPILEAAPEALARAHWAASFDKGRLVDLADLDAPLTGPGQLWLYEDMPAYFDAWDVDHDLQLHGSPVEPMAMSVIEHDPLMAVLEGTQKLGAKSSVTLRYSVQAECPWLFVELDVDWQEDHRLLRYELPTRFAGINARYGSAFGAVSRPQQPGTIAAEAMWEVPGSRWAAAINDDGEGLAVVTEAKYGFRCRDGMLGVTLLRAPTFPDETADRGKHTIRFAIGAYSDGSSSPSTASAAETLYGPWLRDAGTRKPLFTTEGGGTLTPCWTVPTDDGYVIRAHETAGRRDTMTLRFAEPIAGARSTDLLGGNREHGPVATLVDDRTVELHYRPYDLVSLKITRA